MKSSFNAYGRTEDEYGKLHIHIWLGHVKPIPIGGTLAQDYVLKGALYQAGCPINITDKVITPFIALTATDAPSAGVITVDAGGFGIAPSVGDFIQTVNKTTLALGTKKAITAVAANASDPKKYDITVDITAAVGDVIVLSPAASNGAVKPNAYLYHDIWLGNLNADNEDTFATGAAVMYHPEGILISRTPALGFEAAMAAAVPGVLQVKE